MSSDVPCVARVSVCGDLSYSQPSTFQSQRAISPKSGLAFADFRTRRTDSDVSHRPLALVAQEPPLASLRGRGPPHGRDLQGACRCKPLILGVRAHPLQYNMLTWLALPFCVQMPGVARVGVGLQSRNGRVHIATVNPGGPAALLVTKDDVLLAVNGVPIENGDALAAQKAIVSATHQSTETGRMLPVRLTLGTLQLPSPKGVDDLFLEIWESEQHGEQASPRKKPSVPLQVSEVVQSL